MSSSSVQERQPLLPQHVNGQQAKQAAKQTAAQAQQYLPSKQTRFSIAKALGALQEGKLPSQKQLDQLLQAFVASDILRPSSPGSRTVRLSDEGARAVQDLKALLTELQNLGDEKNGDDKIQEFIWSTVNTGLEVDAPSASSATSRAPSKRQAQADAQRALQSLRSIGNLLITSSEFRLLVSSLVLTGRDILSDALSLVADKADQAADATRPDEKEREEGVDWTKVGDKGKAIKKDYDTGRLQGNAQVGAADAREGLEKYIDEKLPASDEAKEQLIERLKKVVIQAQQNPEYKEAIRTIRTLVTKWFNTSKAVVSDVANDTKVNDTDDSAKDALYQLKAIIEAFADKSLDPVMHAMNAVFKDVQNDKRLSAYFDEVSKYFDRILYDEGYVTTHRAYQRGSDLYDRAQEMIKSDPHWKGDAEKLQKELEDFSDALREDEATERVLDKLSDLSSDVSEMSNAAAAQLRMGGLGLIRDAFDVVIPRIIAAIHEIPLPRTEYMSEDVDLVIDDLIFESASFIPDNVRFVSHNDLRLTQGFAAYSSDLDASVRLQVDGLRLHAKEIAYWFHKKTGYFVYEDSGLLDISLDGKGLAFDVTLENAPESARESFFVVSKVSVDLSSLTFNVTQNNHWFLTWFGKPFIRSLIESNLRVLLEGQISSYLRSLDLQLFALQQRAIAATNARPSSPVDYLRAMFSTSALPSLNVKSGRKVTQNGIIKTGPRGSYVLAIGIDEQLFPGKAGGTGETYSKRKDAKDAARDTYQRVRDIASRAPTAGDVARGTTGDADVDAAVGGVRKDANEMDRARREQRRVESRKDGWKSEAFDI